MVGKVGLAGIAAAGLLAFGGGVYAGVGTGGTVTVVPASEQVDPAPEPEPVVVAPVVVPEPVVEPAPVVTAEPVTEPEPAAPTATVEPVTTPEPTTEPSASEEYIGPPNNPGTGTATPPLGEVAPPPAIPREPDPETSTDTQT